MSRIVLFFVLTIISSLTSFYFFPCIFSHYHPLCPSYPDIKDKDPQTSHEGNIQKSGGNQTLSQPTDIGGKGDAKDNLTKGINNHLLTDTSYTSSQNRLETLTLDIQSLEDRTKALFKDQLNRDKYLDPSSLK